MDGGLSCTLRVISIYGMLESMISDLTDLIVQERIKGLSYFEIAKKHEIDALEAREMVREALTISAPDDEWEQRGIMMLRAERVIQKLWDGLESGSFKHAEALVKTLDHLASLLALNKQVMESRKAEITDQQAQLVYEVMTRYGDKILQYINKELAPNKRQLAKLEEWPQIAADASTDALEEVIYVAEEVEE